MQQTRDNDGWDEFEDDEVITAQCLFCDEVFPSAEEVFSHCKTHGFDLVELKNQIKFDFYGCIRLINYVRAQHQEGKKADAILKELKNPKAIFWTDEKYLKPVLENDALLMNLDDFLESKEEEKGETEYKSIETYKRENEELRSQIEDLKKTLAETLASLKSVKLQESPSSKKKAKKKEVKRWKKVDHDAGYFEGYSSRYIHDIMLRDQVRTLAYRDFFYENKDFIKDKVVLDVGCGTGILCLFAAHAGARRVIGVDRADIIDKAKVIVKANKMDHIISLHKSKVEDLVLPPGVEKVDLIISEWMGYFLLFESMLPSVLYARDRWLAPGGGVYPNKASMFIAGFEASDYNKSTVEFWKDVYGFDMSCLIEATDHTSMLGCEVSTLDAKSLITDTATIKSLDLHVTKTEDLDFTSPFVLTVDRDENLDGFVVWFDAVFDKKLSHPITLSTSPLTTETHWKQTIFYIATSIPVKKGDTIKGELKARRRKGYKRDYEVEVVYSHVSKATSKESVSYTQNYTIT